MYSLVTVRDRNSLFYGFMAVDYLFRTKKKIAEGEGRAVSQDKKKSSCRNDLDAFGNCPQRKQHV